MTDGTLVLRSCDEHCLETHLYFFTPYSSTENLLWGVSGTDMGMLGPPKMGGCMLLLGTQAILVFCCWWWNVVKSLCIPCNKMKLLWGTQVDSCLWGCGGCISLLLFSFGWALNVYTWVVTLCLCCCSICFCFALFPSPLWIKYPYWSCRYVGWFYAEVLFSENSSSGCCASGFIIKGHRNGSVKNGTGLTQPQCILLTFPAVLQVFQDFLDNCSFTHSTAFLGAENCFSYGSALPPQDPYCLLHCIWCLQEVYISSEPEQGS